MKVKATIIECIWDNYQGGSGINIKREILVEIDSFTIISEVDLMVIDALQKKGIKSNLDNNTFDHKSIISIEILPNL